MTLVADICGIGDRLEPRPAYWGFDKAKNWVMVYTLKSVASSVRHSGETMIPVPIFSYLFLALLLISAISLVTLISWIALLCVSRRRRAAFRARFRLALTFMVLLASLSSFVLLLLYQFYRMDVEIQREEAARYTVLQEARTVAGIMMPAGSRLHSREPGKIEEFDEVSFPHPLAFNGLMVVSLKRSVYQDLKQGFVVSSVEATLAFDQAIDGWICQKQVPLVFDIVAGTLAFQACTLASGNSLGNWVLPTGAELRAERQFTHAWTVFLDSNATTRVRNLPLRGARLAVDKNHQWLGFSEAVLATDLHFGSVRYMAGTRVSARDWELPGKSSDTLIFSPVQGQVAKPDQGPDVPFGSSIVQTVSGDVQAIISNQDAGIVDFDPFFLLK